MNRADRWLHGELRAIEHWRGDEGSESLEHALAGLDALEFTGAISAATASEWREAFAGERRVVADAGVRARAERFLAEVRDDPERFESALGLFSAVGVVDRQAWAPDEDGEAELLALNAHATMADLVQVIAGPADARAGYRLLFVLRFADGVALTVDQEVEGPEWPFWELSDDVGTSYDDGFGTSERITFNAPIPPAASWIDVRLRQEPDVVFRVRLD